MNSLQINDKTRLLKKLRQTTVGIDLEYRLATGEKSRRIYLDSTASTLQLGLVSDVISRYMPFYSNTHTSAHFGAKLSTVEFDWAHNKVLSFVNADPQTYTAFFVGSGATGGINRVARTLREKRPQRRVVITSIMEHHSNDLPHRRHFDQVVHVPTQVNGSKLGCIDLSRIEKALQEHGDNVNYISVTGVSNVTGIKNPVYDIADLAHRYNTLILVDAAQMAAHVPIKMSGHENPARNIDMIALSGHKMYAPSSPGVVITRKDLFSGIEPVEVGGGMVDDVHINRYLPTDNFPDREEAGTPNIVGAIALAAVMHALQTLGMDFIDQEESRIIRQAIDMLEKIDDLMVYGNTDPNNSKRIGALSFNIKGMDHALTAAILNDYFNISVRNACFCAQPYVREMITDELGEIADQLSNEELEALAELHRGMVRASFGIYNDSTDVQALVDALQTICNDREFYQQQYEKISAGDYRHKTFNFDCAPLFSAANEVNRWLAG
ncbi:aminotransferase class V-fold PLP-dependent enzyme [Candidatus Spongiihabitans sp.]|uniref:aminotransferase class V-fold PLP-dependent enzyme n=1 Tax=Candidatus Spongiihabitans sp. TaxID=3101308 RepID=UPI003C6EDF8F